MDPVCLADGARSLLNLRLSCGDLHVSNGESIAQNEAVGPLEFHGKKSVPTFSRLPTHDTWALTHFAWID
jgi:hypothetical protein